jgi:beta-lactamase class A
VLAAAILTRVDLGKERLDRRLSFGESDLLDYAPITREHLGEGSMKAPAWSGAFLCRSMMPTKSRLSFQAS